MGGSTGGRDAAGAAFDAWRRGDVAAAVSVLVESPSEPAQLTVACAFAVAGRRVDLLEGALDRIRSLPPSVAREAALAIAALGAGECERARHLIWGMLDAADVHDGEARVEPVAGGVPEAAVLRLAAVVEFAFAATASGRWFDLIDAVRVGRGLLGVVPGVPITDAAAFDLAGFAAVAECHTGDARVEFEALRALIAGPRSRNLLTADHAVAVICLGSVQHAHGHWGEAAIDLARGIGLVASSRPGLAAHARVELALVRVRQGRWSDAERLVNEVSADFEAVDRSWLATSVAAARGLMTVLHGRLGEGERMLATAAALAVGRPTHLAAVLLVHARACLAIARNDWLALHRLLDDAEDPGYRRPFRPGEWRALRLLAA